jgi:hypothetical protein
MNFDSIHKIAAAMLYEGYILYPYRPSAIKNRQRWNFGTLYPWIYADSRRPAEPSRFVVEALVVPGLGARFDFKISFLQLLPKADDGRELRDPSLAWDEAVERSWELNDVRLDDLIATSVVRTLEISDAVELRGILTISAQALPDGACRIRCELENVSPLASGADARREEALPRSFVSAHLLLGVTDGEFISLLDPPEQYSASAAACANVGIFPVLAGEEPDRSMMLCSPIILYDYPKIAPESEGDFFDGTEMDEMLTLRVLTLTDAEKEEMRNGDPRGRRILERTEALTNDAMLKAHGIVRGMRDIRGDAR